MKTLKVDSKRRIRLPEAKPNEVYKYQDDGKGCFTLTLIQTEEAFPPGSLTKYITKARDKEQVGLLKGCTLETK